MDPSPLLGSSTPTFQGSLSPRPCSTIPSLSPPLALPPLLVPFVVSRVSAWLLAPLLVQFGCLSSVPGCWHYSWSSLGCLSSVFGCHSLYHHHHYLHISRGPELPVLSLGYLRPCLHWPSPLQPSSTAHHLSSLAQQDKQHFPGQLPFLELTLPIYRQTLFYLHSGWLPGTVCL